MHFQRIDAPLAFAAKASILRHLWYLTDSLVVFALFDGKLDWAVKEEMATALLQTQRPAQFPPGKPAFPRQTLETIDNIQLPQLIGPRSWLLFHLLDADGDWLNIPPQQWDENQEFKQMSDIVRNLAVVNDAAERGVKDIQDYANAAMDGTCRERIVLVSNSHHVKIPQFLKNEMEENL